MGSMWRSSKRVAAEGRPGYPYLAADQVYLDSACQTLRPQPVIDALTDYYVNYSACGERVKYAWGRKVDEAVAATRERVLSALGLSRRTSATSFTLNTTYGINLLLNQLPEGRHRRVVTTRTEHNSVFLPTIAFAKRRGVERVVLARGEDGSVDYRDADLADALVVLSAMNNVDGAFTANLADLVADAHRAGATVVVDAAQAAPHALARLKGIPADAICFSAHKMYGPSLGVVAASHSLLESLDISFIGGGQVSEVTQDGYTLHHEPHSRLEPGLQAWGEIIAFGAALDWIEGYRKANGEDLEAREARLAQQLFDGLSELPHATLRNRRASSVVSLVPERVDAHRLATFLGAGGVMVRSGYFCAHHWLQETERSAPLVRFSIGAHNDESDVERALEIAGRMLKGL